MKIKCDVCKKSFNSKTYIKAVLDCPKWTCGLKQSTLKNDGVGVGTQEALIKPLAVDYCSRPGSKPGTPTKLRKI